MGEFGIKLSTGFPVLALTVLHGHMDILCFARILYYQYNWLQSFDLLIPFKMWFWLIVLLGLLYGNMAIKPDKHFSALVENRTAVLIKLLGRNIYTFSCYWWDEWASPLHFIKVQPPFGLTPTPDCLFSKSPNTLVFLSPADLCWINELRTSSRRLGKTKCASRKAPASLVKCATIIPRLYIHMRGVFIIYLFWSRNLSDWVATSRHLTNNAIVSHVWAGWTLNSICKPLWPLVFHCIRSDRDFYKLTLSLVSLWENDL